MSTAGSERLRNELHAMGTPEADVLLEDDRRLTKLDRAIAGLSPERGSELLRLVVNLGIDPDDHAWMLVAAAGVMGKFVDELPASGKALIDQIEVSVEKFEAADMVASRARKREYEKLVSELRTEAVKLAEAAMRSQFVEEEAKNRLRITTSIDSAFKAYRDKLFAERSRLSKEQTRSLGIAAVVVALTLGVGLVGGLWLGGVRAVAIGAVSDGVYRLEVLGAGWEQYRSTLSMAQRLAADRYMAHHTVYVPNPRGR